MQQVRLAEDGQNTLYVCDMRLLLLIAIVLALGSAPACAADAVPATAFFPILPYDAPPDSSAQWVPLAANHPLDGIHTGITRAIVVIPDETRDANNALATMSALAGMANASTMILSPQFLLPSDLVRFADHLPDKGIAFAAWPLAAWPSGDESLPSPAHKGVSSFTVVDLLLMYLSDRNAFPDLQVITVAGVGMGGNFVQRYAALSAAAEPLSQQNIELRYVVGAASSYLYMTANRPLGGRKGFGKPDAAQCPDYNSYPYGLDKLNSYARRVGTNAAKTNYAMHVITYLNAPGKDTLPESYCAALMQGSDSASRATNYNAYLQSLYGDVAAHTQIFSTLKDPQNDAVSLFGSACGMAALFGDGSCAHITGDTQ